MKRKLALFFSLVMGVALLAACGSTASSSSSASSVPAGSSSMKEEASSMPVLSDMVYRGKLTEVSDTTITVEQLPGHNYGFETVVFNLTDETKMQPEGGELVVGGFVEVTYNGVMTRSIPPQATAAEIYVLSNSDVMTTGIIVNGTIETVDKIENNLHILVAPVATGEVASAGAEQGKIVLIVPTDALEGITEAELVEGTIVSAVTNGIAALSEPPQMSVRALLLFNWETA